MDAQMWGGYLQKLGDQWLLARLAAKYGGLKWFDTDNKKYFQIVHQDMVAI